MSALLIGGNGTQQIAVETSTLNRHGLIAGATGTGKTVTLQVLVEQLSAVGIPVFLADVKGDLSGLASAGSPHKKVTERLDHIGIGDHPFHPAPCLFWDVFGEAGHPIRTTISELGPLLLSNLLQLNETQTGILYACFKEADSNGLLMLDLDDLNAMLGWLADNAKDLRDDYGNISAASVGAIRRKLLILEEQGAKQFFAEPAVELGDLMCVNANGKGLINILDATQLMQKSPRLYSTILLWLLSELFESLPEVGDQAQPKFVLFLDEAHLLFDGASKSLSDKIEQVVRLIRSKGVGVFFVSQSPMDIPEDVAGQLGLKIQHALRAFTPKDKKMLKSVADGFRPNPTFDTNAVLPELGIGEALVSGLDAKGSPTIVEKTLIRPPSSKIGPIMPTERKALISGSHLYAKYQKSINRESAYEQLEKRAEEKLKADATQMQRAERERQLKKEREQLERARKKKASPTRSSRRRQSTGEAFVKSITRALGSQIGRQIGRGILGSLFKR